LGAVGRSWVLLGVVGRIWVLHRVRLGATLSVRVGAVGAGASVEVAGTSYFHTPYAPATGRGMGENNEMGGSTITASMPFRAAKCSPFQCPTALWSLNWIWMNWI